MSARGGRVPFFSENDRRFMRRALRLAARGKGRTSPNPAVGAVVARGDKIIGEGWHRRSGEAHAEILAIERAGEKARGSTLYVTLEPCSTYGKTPPCTSAIARSGISRVVAACLDPNPCHNGRGARLLRRGGIRVETGLLEAEARRLNEDFIKYVRTGLPFTTVKAAMSLDGKIAATGGDSRWITCDKSRRYAHKLRSWSDAILVGKKTVERDDPLLTARSGWKIIKSPWRIVLASAADIPYSSRLLRPESAQRTIVAVTDRAPRAKLNMLKALGARVIKCHRRGGRVSLKNLWRALGRMGIMSVLIEGGGETIASALEEGLVDRIVLFIAPKIIGGRGAPTAVAGRGIRSIADAVGVKGLSVRRIGEDLVLEGEIKRG